MSDAPEDSEGRSAILSVPVLTTNADGAELWSLGTRDARFYDRDAPDAITERAASVGPYSQAVLDAVAATGEDADRPLYANSANPVAWAHVFADPRDTDADPSEFVNVVWTVELDGESDG